MAKSFAAQVAAANTSGVDKVCVDVPLLIRLMEYAREDASDDMALHTVAENLTNLMKTKDVATMDDYDTVVKA